MDISRRQFVGGIAAGVTGFAFESRIWAAMSKHPLVGTILPKWQKGHFRISTLYTGRSESAFLVFADGTSMLIDCGDYSTRKMSTPFLPDGKRSGGEYIARYILRENPFGNKVDYFMLSHYHSDHMGHKGDSWGTGKGGRHQQSGLGAAIDFIDFSTVIDRSWPDLNDPAPRPDNFERSSQIPHIREVYTEMIRRGVKVEKFKLEKDSKQIELRHGGNSMFGFTPLVSAGKLLQRDGTVRDLGTTASPRSRFPENPLSCGGVFHHGDFRYYSTGDFEGRVKAEDGSYIYLEDELAKEVPQVDVAKANHHATHGTMRNRLLAALQARVVTIPTWHQNHSWKESMRRIAAVKWPCLCVPGYLSKKRREKDNAEKWMKSVAPETYGGVHSVIDVSSDGKSYTLMLVDAHDEKGMILGAYDFKTSPKRS